jgi:hypothetical protein
MMWGKLGIGMLLFTALHTLVWFSTNLQFMKSDIAAKSLQISLFLAIPATMCAYFASKATYQALEGSVWAVRFIGFGTSYLVFPLLTWWLLQESMLTPKTLICIGLSVLIVCIQVFWR